MTALDGNVHDQLRTLQRRISDLAMRMPNPPVAIGMPGHKRDVRFAKAVSEEGEYPTSGKRVPIVFVDLSIISESTISPVDRSSVAQDYAYNISEGNYGSFLPPEGTLIVVIRANGKWWMDYRPHLADEIEGTVAADFSFSNGGAQMNVTHWNRGVDPSGGSAISVINPPSGRSDRNFAFEGEAGLRIWATRYFVGGYRIRGVECKED